MGNWLSNQTDFEDYTDDSSYSSDEENESADNSPQMNSPLEVHQHKKFNEERDNCFDSATDAVCSTSTGISTMPIVVTLDNIIYIEENLDLYEKVSVVYLLYENPQIALQELNKLLNGGSEKLLYNWAIEQSQLARPWKEKFIEAICIIQNYEVLRNLGYEIKDLKNIFLPHHMFSGLHVNKQRKALYMLCEDLPGLETRRLLDLVYADFQRKGLEFTMFNSSYLELFLLYWETVGYIKQDNLNNLYAILKQLEYFDMIDNLKKIVPSLPAITTINIPGNERIEKEKLLTSVKSSSKTVDANKKNPKIFEEILAETSLSDLRSLESLDTAVSKMDGINYHIDPENPGICLIINQENFYKEVDTQYKHLLPPRENSLEPRTGTQKDKKDLEATFKMFNFKTEVVDNLTHIEIIEKIGEVVQSVKNESSLFVCVMSHGDEGVIYGVNSCRVSVRKIQNLMCSKNRHNLLGKPKILILQSCQGTTCQKISPGNGEDDCITTDSPSSSNNQEVVPPIADLFTFWATVPGYAAVRNKKTGSWFIQSLCQKMKDLGNKYHFEDICTFVINDVSSKKWITKEEDVAMVPLKDSTLRKSFYLPPLRN